MTKKLLLLLLLCLSPLSAFGMEHHYQVLHDQKGNVIRAAAVHVYNTGTTTYATLYSDNGVTTKANPFTTSSGTSDPGAYDFYAANGAYDIVFVKNGYSFNALLTKRTTLNDPADGSGGGSSAFNAITTGSNTTATMTVGAGASVVPTSTGIIAATAVRPKILTVSSGNSPYTGLNTDAILLCDTSAAGRTITLPAASVKMLYIIKNLGTFSCTVNVAGVDTIDGGSSAVLTGQYDAINLVSDGGTAWSIF